MYLVIDRARRWKETAFYILRTWQSAMSLPWLYQKHSINVKSLDYIDVQFDPLPVCWTSADDPGISMPALLHTVPALLSHKLKRLARPRRICFVCTSAHGTSRKKHLVMVEAAFRCLRVRCMKRKTCSSSPMFLNQGFLTGGIFHPCSGKFFLIWCSEKLFYSNTYGRKFEY